MDRMDQPAEFETRTSQLQTGEWILRIRRLDQGSECVSYHLPAYVRVTGQNSGRSSDQKWHPWTQRCLDAGQSVVLRIEQGERPKPLLNREQRRAGLGISYPDDLIL